MNHFKISGLGMVLAVIFVTSSGHAETMRCGNRVTAEGATRYEVKSVCGDPDDAVQRVEYRTVRQRMPGPCMVVRGQRSCDRVVEQSIEVVVDEWTYDFGRNRFIRYLTFEQGRLIRITNGPYGRKDPT